MHVGGTERHLLHILPLLTQRGFEITVVLLEKGGLLENELRASVNRVLVPTRAYPRPLRTLAQSRLIRSAVRDSGARVVHAFLSEPYLAAAAAQITLPSPRPALVHGRRSLSFYSKRHRLGQKAEIAAHGLASALVGNSEAVIQELAKEAGSMDKVCLIPNGIPFGEEIVDAQRQAARQTFGLPTGAFVMTMVANLHVYKGHADLIAALKEIRESLPQPWRLLLVGRDGQDGERERLGRMVRDAGLTDNIVFAGEWPGSREPYEAADMGLLVSHTEGFSNSLIEGMAAGLPMVATAVGGNVDAIEDGVTGYLVPPSAPHEIAQAILSLAQMPRMRAKLGQAARAVALERYSLQRCVDRYETLWRGLADQRTGTPASWLTSRIAVSQGR
jgi:glycosyltransferase involved in cell wall biosynthesis